VGNVSRVRNDLCGPSRKRPYANGCFADSEIGKPAVTHYKVLERFGYVTISPAETGRTHQIRVHFKHMVTLYLMMSVMEVI
jgi:23S rRNA-/tRNA-specific pseudouridylate synthase